MVLKRNSHASFQTEIWHLKDFCSLKTHPCFFVQRSLLAAQAAKRNTGADKSSQTVEHAGKRRVRFSSGCTSLPLVCSCLLMDVRYLQTATQLTALLATCRWLSCVHAGQVFAQTQANRALRCISFQNITPALLKFTAA